MHHRISNLHRPFFKFAFFTFTFFAITITQLFAPSAWAARVIKAKGNAVLVDLEGDASAATVGDKYFIMVNGKKRGLVTLTKIKGGKALANLDKGQAANGAPLALARAAGGSGGDSHQASNSRRSRREKPSRRRADRLDQLKVGALVGYSSDAQNVKLTNTLTVPSTTETVNLKGSGASLKGFAMVPLSGNLGLTGRGGFELFKVSGTSSSGGGLCTGSVKSDCYTKVTYLTIDALLRYQFPMRSWTPFVSAGLGIYVPMSKSTTALNPNISTTSVFTLGLGADINVGKNAFIPVTVEYGILPSSSDVSSHAIAFRLGYGVRI